MVRENGKPLYWQLRCSLTNELKGLLISGSTDHPEVIHVLHYGAINAEIAPKSKIASTLLCIWF